MEFEQFDELQVGVRDSGLRLGLGRRLRVGSRLGLERRLGLKLWIIVVGVNPVRMTELLPSAGN
eukprot:1351501-Amorphochlora_amoeboformis.AAC.1